MIRPITINLFGGPGSGKSTASAAVFSLLKMHEINAELVTEFAKDLTWEERFKTLSNQYYIWGKQHNRMWRIRDKVDVIVTDSPLLLSIIYGEEKPTCFKETVLHSFNDGFDNVNYVLTRSKAFNKCGRTRNEEESKKLDLITTEMLNSYKIGFRTVPGNYTGANIIIKDALKRLGKKIKLELSLITKGE